PSLHHGRDAPQGRGIKPRMDADDPAAREGDLAGGCCRLRVGIREDPHGQEGRSALSTKPLAPGIEAALGDLSLPAEGGDGLAASAPWLDNLLPTLLPLASSSRQGSALRVCGAILTCPTRCGSPDGYGFPQPGSDCGWSLRRLPTGSETLPADLEHPPHRRGSPTALGPSL